MKAKLRHMVKKRLLSEKSVNDWEVHSGNRAEITPGIKQIRPEQMNKIKGVYLGIIDYKGEVIPNESVKKHIEVND